jgi:2-polyprenyl-3-methyl-5-hydroxy-6-metoxy-1,4-benzoquinol methylase
MEPSVIGRKYDKIAQWWHDQHVDSEYGIKQFEKALNFCTMHKKALDVGCGSGGRFIQLMQDRGFSVTGIDVSKEMISLAKKNHPSENFFVQDICTWETMAQFDFIVAWDSIFHLPFSKQKPVLSKLSNLLSSKGVLIYTFGNENGEHTDQWNNDTFYYSSIGINENIKLLLTLGLNILHLELDQYPENHVYIIATKP